MKRTTRTKRNRDPAMCGICYDDESSVKDGVDMVCCNAHVHVECIQQIRSPSCPFCRAPIDSSQSDTFNLELINQRQAQDEEERRLESLVAYFERFNRESSIATLCIGTPEFDAAIVWFFSHTSLPRLLSYQTLEVFVEYHHAPMHQYCAQLTCDAINLFLQRIWSLFVLFPTPLPRFIASGIQGRQLSEWMIKYIEIPVSAMAQLRQTTDTAQFVACYMEAARHYVAKALVAGAVGSRVASKSS